VSDGGVDDVDEVDEVDVEPDVDEDEDDDENRAPAPTAKAVLAYLARAVVDDADSVEVDVVEGRRVVGLQVHVAPGDMGRVIGKRGRVATSIRTIVRAAAVRDGVDVDVDFVD
jgi:predicted RNA-binding protein YlqC (UPF0109 family)